MTTTTTPTLPPIPALPARDATDERFSLLEMDHTSGPTTPDVSRGLTPEMLLSMINTAEFMSDLKRIAGDFNSGTDLASIYFRSLEGKIQDNIRGAWRARRDTLLRDAGMWAATALRCMVPAYRAEQASTIEGRLAEIAAEIPAATRPARRYTSRQTARDIARTEARAVESARRTGDLIAMAVRAGLGATLTRGRSRGKGLIKRADIVQALENMGLSHLAPASPSAVKQLGEAIKTLNNQGLVARAALKHERTDGVKARWIVGTVDFRVENPSLGEKDLLIDLLADDTLRLTGGSRLAETVRREYERRIAGETYSASAAWDWLVGRLAREYHVVDLDGEHYVAGGMVGAVQTLVTSLSSVLGRRISMRGVATADDIRDDLASGLYQEADALRERLLSATEGTVTGIGARAALTLLRDVVTVRERVGGYAGILSDEGRTRIQATLAGVESACRSALDDTAQRGSMIELD